MPREKRQQGGRKVDEFSRLSSGIADSMGVSIENASQAVEHGWNPEKIDVIQNHVERWNGILGTKVECVFEPSTKKGVSPREVESQTQVGIQDGKLNFTQAFAAVVLEAPNIIIGHECGHEIERKLNPQSRGTTEGLQAIEAYSSPGFDDPSKKHSCPPFGVVKHHQPELLRLFTSLQLQAEVGYGARQIYADSVPVKEALLSIVESQQVEGVDMEDLLSEWLTLLDSEYQHHHRNIRSGGREVWLAEVPHLARFTATALALRKIAGAWVEDPDKARETSGGFDSFIKRFAQLLTEPESVSGESLTEQQAYDLLETPLREYRGPKPSSAPRKSGLSEDEVMAVAVLTRAYKEHFINCMSRGELFEGERLEPHLEKLTAEDEYTRRREAYTLGEIGSVRAVEVLVERRVDSSPLVREGAFAALLEIIVKNPGDPKLREENTLEGLVNFSEADPSKGQKRIISGLLGIGESAIPKLIEFVGKDLDRCHAAIDTLRGGVPKYTIPFLIAMFDAPGEMVDMEDYDKVGDTPDIWEYRVANRAHLMVTEMGVEVVPEVIKYLEGGDGKHVHRFAMTLGVMGSPAKEAIPILEKIAETETHSGSEVDWALGSIYGGLGNKRKQYEHWNKYLGERYIPPIYELDLRSELHFVQDYERRHGIKRMGKE
ncbi:MAG: hypothetical protein ABH851_01760 [Methanobacteriota archaeon]